MTLSRIEIFWKWFILSVVVVTGAGVLAGTMECATALALGMASVLGFTLWGWTREQISAQELSGWKAEAKVEQAERLGVVTRLIDSLVEENSRLKNELVRARAAGSEWIRSANMIIVALDQEGKITKFNQAAEHALGYKEEEILGMPWTNFIRKGETVPNEEPVPTGGDPAPPQRSSDTSFLHKSGIELAIRWQSNPIREDGRETGTLYFGVDLTEKRKLEEQRLAIEKKLLDAQKLESLGVLAGGIAHDFNNLLAAILGNANLAGIQLAPGSPAGSYLKNIEKASLRAADLCKQMLAYCGRGRASTQYLNMNDVVGETMDLLEVSLSKKASLRVELRPELPQVLGDPAQIRQVIMNLVINASDAMEDNPGLVRVRTGVTRVAPSDLHGTIGGSELVPGEHLFVEVSDTGCGMSPETLQRIFDPFFTTKRTGRGLGLSAVMSIVQSHRGALKISSELGKGSVFRLLLPTAKSIPEVLERNGSHLPDAWRGEGRVLVVDDDPCVRAVTARMVEACGFEVLQAVDGRHGVQVFDANRNDIRAVVLDMAMPNLNGREAFEQMRRIRPDVKVLLVSGFSENLTTRSFAGEEPAGFLQKPFLPDQLTFKLRSILNGAALQTVGHG